MLEVGIWLANISFATASLHESTNPVVVSYDAVDGDCDFCMWQRELSRGWAVGMQRCCCFKCPDCVDCCLVNSFTLIELLTRHLPALLLDVGQLKQDVDTHTVIDFGGGGGVGSILNKVWFFFLSTYYIL